MYGDHSFDKPFEAKKAANTEILFSYQNIFMGMTETTCIFHTFLTTL